STTAPAKLSGCTSSRTTRPLFLVMILLLLNVDCFMLLPVDARRGRLLTNSPYTQTSGAELGSLHEGSSVRLTQPSIGEVPTASLESCRFVSRWSSLQVPSRDIRAPGHASRRVHKTTFTQPTARVYVSFSTAAANLLLVR